MAAAKWFFRNDKLEWTAVKEKEAAALEAGWANHESSLSLHVGPFPYTFDLVELTQRNDKTGTKRHLKRVAPSGEVTTRQAVWEWEDAHGGHYTAYPKAVNDAIEVAYKQDRLLVRVPIAVSAHDTKTYIVHFGHMHQHPEDKPDAARRIRRLERSLTRMPTAAGAGRAGGSGVTTMPLPTHTVVPPTTSSSTAPVVSSAPAAAPMPPKKAGVKRSASPGAGIATATSVTGGTVDPPKPKFAPKPVGEPVTANASLSSATWAMYEKTVMGLAAHSPAPGAVLRVASFDMDDTIIRPKSMDAKKKKFATFAKGPEDWEWLHPTVPERLRELHGLGYMVLFISNQGGIAKDASKASWVKTKVLKIQDAAKVPISFMCATHEDHNRKPGPAMWHILTNGLYKNVTVDAANSFYCGDAAGRVGYTTLALREKDFSCSDRKFAFSCGLSFMTPEEWLVGTTKPANFTWEGLGPADLDALASNSHPAGGYDVVAEGSAKPELVVMVGFPGSGKSSFFRNFFKPAGYVHANRDTLKTMDKCVAAADAALKAGKSVCVDNTSPEPSDRAMYLKVAKQHGVRARVFHMQASKELAWHMNLVRAQLGISARVSSIGYNIYKGKFREPTTAEGFDAVVKVPVVPDFTGLPPQARQLLLHSLT